MSTSKETRHLWWSIALLPPLAITGMVISWQIRQANPRVAQTPGEAHRKTELAAESSSTVTADERGYVTSQACQKCHPKEYSSWHASYHRTMTQPVTPDSIAAPLDGTHLEAFGREYDFAREGDKFYVTMASPQWEQSVAAAGGKLSDIESPRRERSQIVQLTGSHHMQTFWIHGESGLRQVPWYWHREEQCWIPSEESFLRPPDAGRMFVVWDAVCIKCHTVGGVPGYNFRRTYVSKFAEMGIACEACHGPGKEHVDRMERFGARRGDLRRATGGDLSIVQPALLPPERASQVCAQCHSTTRPRDRKDWLAHGSPYRPGDDLDRYFREIRFDDRQAEDEYYVRDGYWADGTCRTGGDEHLGLVDSACYTRGKLSCLSCHSLHNYADRDDQLKPAMDGNDACYQCHADFKERLIEHTRHTADSPGSICYNCHMPHVTYALFKGIRSHRIDIPSAAVSSATGRPNACNLCHLDKSLRWADQKLAEWRQTPASAPSVVSGDDREVSAAVRWLLAGDAAQRVVAAWHMGWAPAQQASGNDWQGGHLAHALNDPYAAVRFVAWRSMKRLPGLESQKFNLAADEEERRQQVQQALARWRQSRPARLPRPSVLLDEHGELSDAAVIELQQVRDERPVDIPE